MEAKDVCSVCMPEQVCICMHVCIWIQRFCFSDSQTDTKWKLWEKLFIYGSDRHHPGSQQGIWWRLSLLHRSVQLITAQDTRCHSSVLSRLWYWEPWHNDILVSDLSDSGQGEWDMLTEVGSGDNESEAGTVQRKLSAQAYHGFLGAGIYPARRYGSLASLPPHRFLSHLLRGSLSWFLCHCSDAKIIGQKQLTGDSFRLTVLEGYST